MDKRIAVLLSGGVDSSVVLCLLARQGLHPDCFYIKIGASPDQHSTLTGGESEWDCSSEEDMEMATSVARKYGCRLEVVDCHREYWEQVTTYTMEKVKAGLTPNPDVMCNRLIKFGAFHEKRGHDYDFIATGHYAQTEIENGKSSNGELKWLTTSPDPVKDQTDFLAQIYDWQLAKALFPIGHLMKDEVRRIAEEEHLVNARRRDSQGICFLGKIDYDEYLRRYLGELPGDVVELETGRLIGKHRGHWFYTIGQRKGLGFGGGPWFVVKKDVEQNVIYVSNGYDPATVYKKDFLIRDFHSINGQMPGEEITFKIRHTPEFHRAKLVPLTSSPCLAEEPDSSSRQGRPGGVFSVCSETAIHGVAPGQFCVVYDAEHHRCYGSGEICL